MLDRKFLITVFTLGLVFVANYITMAVFQEPAGIPPGANTPAPINVGSDFQEKFGDLKVNELAASAITLNGDRRVNWPAGGAGGAACSWEGMKCDCSDDTSTFADTRLTMGLTCVGGQITNMEIVNFEISSGSKECSKNPPKKCAPSLYTYD